MDPLLKIWGRESWKRENSRDRRKALGWQRGEQGQSERAHELITRGQGLEFGVHLEKTADLSGCFPGQSCLLSLPPGISFSQELLAVSPHWGK